MTDDVVACPVADDDTKKKNDGGRTTNNSNKVNIQRDDDDDRPTSTKDRSDPPPEGDPSTATDGKKERRNRRTTIAHVLLFVPYALGVAWTCLHPVASILTGETKCRGWFLDEHSVELRFVDGQVKHPNSLDVPSYLKSARTVDGTASFLCDNLLTDTRNSSSRGGNNVLCHKHRRDDDDDSSLLFEVVMIQPRSNALDATEEGVVLVLPSLPSTNSNLHKSLLQAIDHLADPIATPWLAKTVYVVTPASPSAGLDETVDNFLDAYLGRQTQEYPAPDHDKVAPPLPPKLSTAILRNLIVVDVTDSSSTGTEGNGNNNDENKSVHRWTAQTHLAVLPQGRHGMLPNADLVFVVGKLLERTSFQSARIYPRAAKSTFLTHGYTQASVDASAFVEAALQHEAVQTVLRRLTDKPEAWQKTLQKYAKDWVDMMLFARTLALGPTPPHATALGRGIDSLTIQMSFDGVYRRDPAEELMQYLVYLTRSLGNLHERLHHSFTLYLLPTPRTFVSHMEYFLPNVLILLPLAVRAFGLLLPAILAARRDERVETTSSASSSRTEKKTKVRMVQFGACVLAAYILVPVAFAHTTLSYIPSLVVTPLLAFPDYASWTRQ